MLFLVEIVRILAHQRNDVLADDRFRRVPVGIDDDLVDLGIDDRRLAVDLADDRGVAQHDAVVLDRLDLGGRDVDHHVAVAEEAGHRAQPHEVGLELAEPHLRADVHRGIGVFAEDAVGRQAVTGLEALHRRVDIGVEGLRDAGAACDRSPETISRLRSASTSGSMTPSLSFLVAGTIGQPPCATMLLILADRLLDIGDGLRREDRQRWRRPCRPGSPGRRNRRPSCRGGRISGYRRSRRDAHRRYAASWAKAARAARSTAIRLAPARKRRRLVFISIPDSLSALSSWARFVAGKLIQAGR